MLCSLHQVAQRIYFLDAGPSSYARTVPRDPDLDAGIAALLANIGWSGIFQLQLIDDGSRSYLIDFNAHLYGSLSLALRSGLNLPVIWVERLVGEKGPWEGHYRPSVRYRHEERDAALLASALRHGDWRAAGAVLVPRARTAHAVFSLRDPAPALTSLRHVRKLARAGSSA